MEFVPPCPSNDTVAFDQDIHALKSISVSAHYSVEKSLFQDSSEAYELKITKHSFVRSTWDAFVFENVRTDYLSSG